MAASIFPAHDACGTDSEISGQDGLADVQALAERGDLLRAGSTRGRHGNLAQSDF